MALALEANEVVEIDDKIHDWRVKGFEELGFTNHQAEVLAEARDAIGFPVYRGDVEKLLARGCDHATAFDLLT